MIYNFQALTEDPRPDIWAKSENFKTNITISLYRHTLDVITLIEPVAQSLSYDSSLYRLGAIMHDIGKAHPLFQARLRGSEERIVFRHEYSSLLFLPVIDKEYWLPVLEMVVAHHKPVKYDKSDRGFLDLFLDYDFDSCFEDHAIYFKDNGGVKFEDWQLPALEILSALGIPNIKPITIVQAREAVEWSLEQVQNLVASNGFNLNRGILMAADHMASAAGHMYELYKLPTKLFQVPDFSSIIARSYNSDVEQQKKIATLYPLSQVEHKHEKCHTLVVAPTGAGKTDFLLKRCQGRVFYILPFQASINAMYKRLHEPVYFGSDCDIRLQHAAAKIIMEQDFNTGHKSYMDIILQTHVGCSVKVCTPHQIASILFATNGYEAQIVDLIGQDIILDEIHTYDSQAQAMVIGMVEVLLSLGCRIHIGSATIPSVLYHNLLQLLKPENTYEVRLNPEQIATYNRHQIIKTKWSDMDTIISKALRENKKILVVFNTIQMAQDYFQYWHNLFGLNSNNSMLIHSRFRRCDRVLLEQRLSEEFNVMDGGCLVVATQVVEVSLDISFDCLITQAAPLDALIQRFGRINRRRSLANIGQLKPCHVLEVSENTLPYSKNKVSASYEVLPDGEVLPEIELTRLLDQVYPDLEIANIDNYKMYQNGRWKLGQLLNNSKSVMLEALAIDGLTGILESDLDNYQDSSIKTSKKQELEIPLSSSLIWKLSSLCSRSEWGMQPFIIPDEYYNLVTNTDDSISLGLVLPTQFENFI